MEAELSRLLRVADVADKEAKYKALFDGVLRQLDKAGVVKFVEHSACLPRARVREDGHGGQAPWRATRSSPARAPR
jgi:hypothetical protein